MMKRCLGFLIVFTVVVMFVSMAAAADKPDADEAVVTWIEGSAQVLLKGAAAGAPLKRGDTLKKDQEVKVGEKSRIEIRFPDGSVMRLSEKSHVKLNEVYYDKKTGGKSVKTHLSIGKLWANIRKLMTADSRVEVKTTNAVAGVRGTVYRVNVEEDNTAMIKVYDGTVYVANPPKDQIRRDATGAPVPVAGPQPVAPPYHEVTMDEWHVIVKSFQQVTVSPKGVVSEPKDFNPQDDLDDWVKWNQERDKESGLKAE